MKTIFSIFAFLGCTFFLSCSDDDHVALPDTPNSVSVTLCGIVVDENNIPLSQVNISAHGHTSITNTAGIFVLDNIIVPQKRCTVQFSKPGFFVRTHAFIPSSSTLHYTRVVLIDNAPTHLLLSASGTTVSTGDGTSIQFQPASFVTTGNAAYNGTVNLAVKHLSPDEPDFGLKVPGTDLAGKDSDNRDVTLQTFGMIGVELKGSSGESLQLAYGKTAVLTFPIALSQLASAPPSIPLWYFDETASLWKQEGSAIKNGAFYVGSVSHFSWWNCDVPYDKAFLSGKVVDCLGNPMPNLVVTFNNQYTLITNQNGIYQSWVPAGITMTVQVFSSSNGGIFASSQVEAIPSLSASQVFVVPDLVVPCPSTIQGVLKSCSGNDTSGTVFIANQGGFISYQYTSSGSFSIPVVANSQITLQAYNSTGNASQTIASPAAPGVVHAGNLILCQATSIPANSFVLNGPSFANQLFLVNPTNSGGGIWTDSSGTSRIDISLNGGLTTGYQVSSVAIAASGNVPGSYPWNTPIFMGTPILGNGLMIAIDDYFLTSYYYVSSIQDSGSVNITQIDSIGGRIKGNFSGSCTIQVFSGLSLSGTYNLTGNFDVPRTY